MLDSIIVTCIHLLLICMYTTHTLTVFQTLFLFSFFPYLLIDLYICVMCICMCAHARTDTCVTRCTCGGQKTTSASILTLHFIRQIFFFVACGCAQQAHWPLSSGDSPVSASHLTIGVLGLQIFNTAPSFT